MNCKTISSIGIVAILLLPALYLPPTHVFAQKQVPSISAAFTGDFLIGAAINDTQAKEKDAVAKKIIPYHFNTLTPENVMKCENIHPTWAGYNFQQADDYVAYAKKHNMFIVGHTLIWHSQLSPFVRNISNADSLRLFMQQHISTVAGKYAGTVQGWDVVNEALNEDGSLRPSIFLRLLGEDYLTDAFKLAAAAAPNTELYYNDYNNEQPKKREGCLKLIKKLQANGARIDGVGIQGHWHTGRVPFKDIEESIEAYAALGLKVMITELDLEVLPRNFNGADVNQRMTASDPALNPYVNGIPDSVLQQQARDYEQLFRIFLKHKDKIARVTFWGVHDGQSWLNGWPVPGRTNYPLIFDRKGNPKPAFTTILALKNQP